MTRIEEAIDYVINAVDVPAINHTELEKEFKNRVISSRNVVRNMKRIGDLNKYLERFKHIPVSGTPAAELYDRFQELQLETYESLYPKFCEKFKNELEDVTVLDDFVIGKTYSSWDISIFSRSYNNQSGIYLIGKRDDIQAVFIKCTLSNGKYPNEWIVENEKLKYYFYSTGGRFSPDFVYNQTILNSKATNVPIYLFIKEDTSLTLNGVYQYESHDTDPQTGSMWFVLNKLSSLEVDKPITDVEYNKAIQTKVKQAKRSNDAERKARLNQAPKKPESVAVITTTFKRNPDVIVEVLKRAKGVCEICCTAAPFIRASDESPYLEVHHMVPLASGGEDTVENAVAICPNCHREAHLGVPTKVVLAALIVHQGNILIARRGPGRSQEGMWEFPGGKLEVGETFEQGLEREILEELGIGIKAIQHFGDSLYPYSEGSIRLKAYWSKWIEGDIQLHEHSEVKWVAFEELVSYEFAPADVQFQMSLSEFGRMLGVSN